MKSKNLIIVLIGLLIVLITAYLFTSRDKTQRDEGKDGFESAKEIPLRMGEERKVGNLNIKMLEITEDSRCPVDTRCVWAGKVSASVELKSGEITSKTTLDTGSNPYMFENYLIKLISVEPEKIAGQEIVQAEYIATFSIEIMDSNRIENTEEDGSSAGRSGIKGFIMIGPICPVQKEGDDSCNDKPTKANIVVKDKKEDVVKNIESMEDGSFSVNLSPGNYVIYTNYSDNGAGGTKPEYVTVEDGKFTEVTIRIDTGIR